jgi:hypothetical protein
VRASGAFAGGGSGVSAQPARTASPRIAGHMMRPVRAPQAVFDFDTEPGMVVILLEALLALALLVFIVWWTMFSGRDRGERRRDDGDGDAP